MSELPETPVTSIYALAHIIHVYCAIAFVGDVFFGILVLSVLHTGRVSRESRREVERAMSHRAVRVMPPVVITLFISGIVMVYNCHLPILHHPFDSFFSIMLSIKILLVVSVLIHFVIIVVKMVWHTLTVGWLKHIYAVVFNHMLFIVFFAKAVLYLSW